MLGLGTAMANINFPVIEIEGNKFQMSIDLNLYAKEAITATLYKFSHLFYIPQSMDSNQNRVIAIFESKDNNIVDDKIVKQFCNELVDQQLRYNTNVQFGHIRDLIVEEAFKPVNTKR